MSNFLISADLISPITLSPIYGYPGGFSPDSINQYEQAVTNNYNDWHPVIQTLIAFKLPLTLTGGWIGSITLFQIICFSLVLGYSFNVILKFTNLKYTIISMLFILLNPQTGYIAMYPWKDISFAIGALLLLTFALQIYITKGEWIKKPQNTVAFIIIAALTTLFRHNALLFTIPLIIAVLFFMAKKRALIVCLSVLLLLVGIKMPLFSALNVDSPDKRQIETLGLPMTIIGAVVTYTPETLDEETLEFAYKVAPKEVWEEKYTYGSYNQVKWDDRTNNEVIEEYGAPKVISMMFKSFMSSKKVAMTALIKLTEASYTVSDDYCSVFAVGITDNSFNIEQHGNGRIQAILIAYKDFATENFPHFFMYLGVLHLVLIATIVDWGVLFLLTDYAHIYHLVSAIIAFVAGLITNFILSKILVFKANEARVNAAMEFVSYAIIGVIGLGITEFIMFLFTNCWSIHYMLSKFIAIVIVFAWNYIARKIIIYKK